MHQQFSFRSFRWQLPLIFIQEANPMHQRLNLSGLRWQLLLTFIVLIVIGFGSITLFAGQLLARGALEDFQSTLRVEALLVASALHEPVEEYRVGAVEEAEVQVVVNRLANETQVQIALLELDGTVWIVSDQYTPFANNLSDSAEVQAALENEVIYELREPVDGQPMLYSAAPVIDHDLPMAIAHLAAPAELARVAVRQRWITLGIGFLGIAVVASALSLWMSSSLTRPLRKLQTAALRLADGDLGQRASESRADEIGDLGRAFNHMATQVKTMLEEQRAFASNASHELRTPLTTMRLRIERLQSGRLDEAKRAKYSAEMEQELIRLSRLVEDLSILARVDSQRLEVGEEQVDAQRLATTVIRELDRLRKERQVVVTLEGEESLPVHANMSHLRLVFRNILENAIKYTPDKGSVHWRLTAKNGQLVSRMTDNGVGISAEHLPNIFKRFYRVDKARNRSTPGSGLGLSLVQSVVQLYHGNIIIESEGLGHGTIVTVSWPLDATRPLAARNGKVEPQYLKQLVP